MSKFANRNTWTTSDLIKRNVLSIGDGYRAKNSEMGARGLPFARAGNINGGFHFEDADILEEESVTRAGEKVSRPGDVVFTSKGTVGRFAFVKDNTPRFVYSPQLCYWRVLDCSVLNPRFLFYWMHTPSFLNQVQSVKGLTDMADYVSLADQRRMTVTAPDIGTQDRVASALCLYDDLIENNTRRIAVLERMAQMLYREWFVNFHFPGHEKAKMMESEMGAVPNGWNLRALPELCSKVIDGTHDTPPPVSEGYPLVTGKHFTSGFIDFDSCYRISDAEHEKVMKRSKPEAGDILFSNIGTLGSIAIVPDRPEFSIKNVALLKPLKNIYSGFLYLHFASPETLQELTAKASGTSQRFFSLHFLRSLKLVTPPDELLSEFELVTEPLIRQRLVLNSVNTVLRKTRDLLLPKLVSGEVSVENLEKEAVAHMV